MNDYRRVYAIGDIHGNYNDLSTILALFREDRYDARIDALVFLGDMIDSVGPAEVAEVVKHVRELSESEDVYVVRGNHEQMLIDAQYKPILSAVYQGWWQQGGQNTYNSYLKKYNYEPDTMTIALDMPKQMRNDIEWFRKLPTLVELNDYYFVHAGLTPGQPAHKSTEATRLWTRKTFQESDYVWNKLVIHGHTSHQLPIVKPNRINIDTSKRGGRVTGIRLQEGKEPLFFDKYGSYPLQEGTIR